ncbi:hypothetical protein MHU86_13844 [Fragilaria crotonensis]|nr:hypothetical protein MHU86_13844 [Fragilaria crotonensis]
MSVFEESNHDDDFIILNVDIDDCPIAELPLTEIYDVTSSLLKDNYLETLRTYILQQLEDTPWLEDQSVSPLFDAGFATYHRRANGDILSPPQTRSITFDPSDVARPPERVGANFGFYPHPLYDAGIRTPDSNDSNQHRTFNGWWAS